MPTTRNDIKGYIERGQAQNATHVIIACDTFDNDNYPVFVSREENVQKKINAVNESDMQKVDEVYNLQIPIEPQLKAVRAYNL
jgi:hypothetical protein